MKSLLFAAIIIGSSCQNRFSANIQKNGSVSHTEVVWPVLDFHAKRLSGSRVQISWHSEPNQSENDFVVMRKTSRNGVFEKIGIVRPKPSGGITDYALTDKNECEDSSFYSIMQVDGKGVRYFSPAKGVCGIQKRRQ